MLRLNNCAVVFEDDILPPINCKSIVTVFGESPNAQIQISVPDYQQKRFVQVDRLRNAKIDGRGNSHTITGISEHLTQTVGAARSQSTMRILVESNQVCDDKERNNV
jgi:hypothetical protein